jgi:hypothetical protein
MNPFYVWFLIFACIGYLIVTDASVARLFVLLTGLVRIKYEQIKWFLLHNPANPLVKFMIHRRSLRLAKQLAKELNK